MCISAGASVSGVSWKIISTPSMVCSSTASWITCVGGISVTVPREVTLPRPASTWPRGPLGSGPPNWNMARRIIGVPASTFSLVTSSRNLSGAMTATLPAFTSASSMTPRTPPKWSTWLWL